MLATGLTALAITCLSTVTLRLIKQNADQEKKIKQLEKLVYTTEHRCIVCAEKANCPAAFSDVCYPCEHFKEEE